jgi:hypothetical protein
MVVQTKLRQKMEGVRSRLGDGDVVVRLEVREGRKQEAKEEETVAAVAAVRGRGQRLIRREAL